MSSLSNPAATAPAVTAHTARPPNAIARSSVGASPSRRMLLVHLALAAIAIVPIALVELPGLGDYLNHLARMHVMAEYDDSPHLRSLYLFTDVLRPYNGMKLVVPALAKVMSIYDAGRVFIAMAMLMPVLGAIVLHRVAWGTAGALPAVAFLFVYNGLLSWGFLNYLLASGLALLLLAAWLKARHWPRWWRALFFAVAATLVYLCHVIAFGAYCCGVAGIEFARAWQAGRGQWRQIALNWAAAAAQAIPGALLISQLEVGRFTVAPAITAFGDLAARQQALASPFSFLGGGADLAGLAALLALATWAVLRRRATLSATLWPAAAVLLGIAVLVPEWIDGTWGMHIRLPLLGVLILLAASNLRLSRREQGVLLAGVAALLVLKATAATIALRQVERDIVELRDLVQAIPEGERVLVAIATLSEAKNRIGPWRMTAQSAMVALIERDVFIPYLFSGVTVVQPLPHLLRLSTPHGHPISRSALAEGITARDGPGMPEGDGQGRRIYWRNWPANFGYVIWQHFGAAGLSHPHLLEQVAAGRSATIYRVRRLAGASP